MSSPVPPIAVLPPSSRADRPPATRSSSDPTFDRALEAARRQGASGPHPHPPGTRPAADTERPDSGTDRAAESITRSQDRSRSERSHHRRADEVHADAGHVAAHVTDDGDTDVDTVSAPIEDGRAADDADAAIEGDTDIATLPANPTSTDLTEATESTESELEAEADPSGTGSPASTAEPGSGGADLFTDGTPGDGSTAPSDGQATPVTDATAQPGSDTIEASEVTTDEDSAAVETTATNGSETGPADGGAPAAEQTSIDQGADDDSSSADETGVQGTRRSGRTLRGDGVDGGREDRADVDRPHRAETRVADRSTTMVTAAVTEPTAPTTASAARSELFSTPSAQTQTGQLVHSQIIAEISPLVDGPDGVQHLQLDLHPAELGPLRVAMRIEDGVVHLRIRSLDPLTGRLLASQIDDLRAALTQAGISAGDLDVGARSFAGGYGDSTEDGDGPDGGDGAAPVRRIRARAVSSAAPILPVAPDDDRVDVLL